MTAICVAGATGWTGRAIADGVAAATDLELRSAVSRSAAGQELHGAPVHGTVASALDGVDVLIDYTSHDVVLGHALCAIERGVAVVIGTSGLTAADFSQIDAAARERGVGVISAGNFSLTAAMAQAAALLVAPHLPHWEVIDYAGATKGDVPSGTARELAERLGEVGTPVPGRPLEEIAGPREARGATVGGTQVHSVRLPSFVVSTEVVFGLPDERLSIRHDAGGSPVPYVAGTLLAARAVSGRIGLTRGLDRLLLAPLPGGPP
jgi:4-hydroxy-tetrahydrodipicolinate reductase